MTQDKSTIADLTPNTTFDPQYKKYKNSAFYLGSFFLKQRRPSRVPATSRRYVKGDPINLIDWKAFARTDTLIIREKREEATAQVLIYPDYRDTMHWPQEGGMSTKSSVAMRIALNLAYQHVQAGDQVRLALLNESFEIDSAVKNLILFGSPTAVLSYFADWERNKFEQSKIQCDLNPQIVRKRQDIIYIISDFINPMDVPQIASSGNTTNFIQLLHSRERNTEWVSDGACYFDESAESIEYLGSALRGNLYQEKLNHWQRKIREEVSNCSGLFVELSEKTPIAEYLASLKILTLG